MTEGKAFEWQGTWADLLLSLSIIQQGHDETFCEVLPVFFRKRIQLESFDKALPYAPTNQ